MSSHNDNEDHHTTTQYFPHISTDLCISSLYFVVLEYFQGNLDFDQVACQISTLFQFCNSLQQPLKNGMNHCLLTLYNSLTKSRPEVKKMMMVRKVPNCQCKLRKTCVKLKWHVYRWLALRSLAAGLSHAGLSLSNHP